MRTCSCIYKSACSTVLHDMYYCTIICVHVLSIIFVQVHVLLYYNLLLYYNICTCTCTTVLQLAAVL